MSEREHRDDVEDDILYIIYIYYPAHASQNKTKRSVRSMTTRGQASQILLLSSGAALWSSTRTCLVGWPPQRHTLQRGRALAVSTRVTASGTQLLVSGGSFDNQHRSPAGTMVPYACRATGVIIQKIKRGHAQGAGHLFSNNNKAPCL